MGERIISVEQAYQVLRQEENKFGEFKKCEFHLHTPASHDYRLIEDRLYSQLNEDEVCKYAIDFGYIKETQVEVLKREYEEKKASKEEVPIKNFKDFIAYGLIAYKLYQENIDLVVVCDHNTVDGYRRLAYALEWYYEKMVRGISNKSYVDCLLGVEVSCSDKNHLIVILNKGEEKKIKKYLEEILLDLNCVEGTYIDSRTLIEEFNHNYDAITYLAHVNTSELAGSMAYNRTLLGNKHLKILGVNDSSKVNSQRNRIKNYVKNKEFSFILEGDAHSIEEIGKRNTWIKFQKKNFQALKKAIRNRSICIKMEEPRKANKYIRGMLTIPRDKGFLTTKNSDTILNAFYTAFSPDLNCIIGGRGTGKSTILKTINIALTRRVNNITELSQIENNKIIYCLFDIEMETYMLSVIPQVSNNHTLYGIGERYKFISEDKDIIKLGDEWIELHKLIGNEFKLQTKKDMDIILNQIFRRAYDINELVSRITDGKINEFIRNVVTYGVEYKSIEKYQVLFLHTSQRSFNKVLRENLDSMIDFISERQELIKECTSNFNELYKDIIQIEYAPKLNNSIEYIQGILEKFDSKKNVVGTYLTYEKVQLFIKDCVDSIGYMQFLNLLLNDRYKDIEQIKSIVKYQNQIKSFYEAEKNLEMITSRNIKQVYQHIKKKVIEDREILQASIMQCLKVTDDFTILTSCAS